MAASGFAGLGYQIVWTQQSALWLGHESAAVLAVVAAFFGGLALGALGLGRRIEQSALPLRWYVACELLIGLWALALIGLIGPFGNAALALIGEQPSAVWQWTIAFGGTFVLLLPATAAMGATLPALERVLASPGQRSIAALYAANTAGAVLGVLLSAFWLVPRFGLTRTALLCGALNLLCAAAAWHALPRLAAPPLPMRPAATAKPLIRLALTGLLGIAYEVLVVRVLSQVAEDTVYTFALLLAVYLIGTALGAAFAATTWAKRRNIGTDSLLAALALACLLGSASLWSAEAIKALVNGNSMTTALAAEALLALAAFGLPTVVMGALFSQLCAEANAAGLSFGRALGVNTLGAACASLLFGVLLTPAFGPKTALLLIPLGYLLLSDWRVPIKLAATAAVAGLALIAPPLAFVTLPEGGRLVSYQDGAMAAVSVVQDADGVSRLFINNRQQEGSSSSGWFDARQALLPLLLHPAPQRALFLGLGTGKTPAAAATQEPALQVDAVELLPEVITASAHFTPPLPNLHLIAADARRYVHASTQRYDVIVSDNFHPARSGSGALYTVEHFRAVRARLNAGGLFCQWLPLHQMDLPTLRSIVQSFLAAYPGGAALLASNSLDTPVIGLVGRAAVGKDGGSPFEASLLRRAPAFGIEDEFALLGSFIAGPAALKHFAGDAPANTDDLPVVASLAPRITYAPDSRPRDRLLSLLNAVTVAPGELLNAATP
ncbi:MAG: fused MFS/spermidine synthase, partial [Microbacteriaceae bacterium]|nr:fused MFS/spermidine synthase [Burkholderiaceae bacterium]